MAPVFGKVLSMLAVMLLLMCCQAKTTPDAMIGRWVTEDGRYNGSALEIGTTSLVFHDVTKAASVCPIKGVSVQKDGAKLVATIRYTNQENVASTATLVWSPEQGGTLWFKNQPNIAWRRAAGNGGVSPAPAPAAPATGG